MDSGFDNSIYYIISFVLTTVCYCCNLWHTDNYNIFKATHQLQNCLERRLPDESYRTVFAASYRGSAWIIHRKQSNCSATDIMHCCQTCPSMHCLAIDALLLRIRCCDMCLPVCYLTMDALLLSDERWFGTCLRSCFLVMDIHVTVHIAQ
jgi:hypothetical protein